MNRQRRGSFWEYEKVLKRPEQQLVHELGTEALNEFLAELAALVQPLEPLREAKHNIGLQEKPRGCSRSFATAHGESR
jgi:hypothetical protein